MLWWQITISACIVSYTLLLLLLEKGWQRAIKQADNGLIQLPQRPITVIIAYRNESAHLPTLIESLMNLDYHNYKVIFVNDHSTDAGPQLIDQCVKNNNKYTHLQLGDNEKGKKAAIASALKITASAIVAVTDADTEIPVQWLKTINNNLTGNTRLLCGALQVAKQKKLINKFFEIDFYSAVSTGLGALGVQIPMYCNGANMAYLANDYKSFVKENKYLQSLPSGDDVFFLHYLANKYGSICAKPIVTPKHIVRSYLPGNIPEFIRQRIRWAGKTPYYKNLFTKAIALLVWLNNAVYLLALLMLLFNWHVRPPGTLFLLAKTVADTYYFTRVLKVYQRRQLVYLLPLFEIMYALYSTILPLLMLVLKPTWKERKLKRASF